MVISIHNLSTSGVKGTPDVIEFAGWIPEEFTEDMSSNFVAHEIPGRSSPLQSYSGGGGRNLSFSITVHRDMYMPEYDKELEFIYAVYKSQSKEKAEKYLYDKLSLQENTQNYNRSLKFDEFDKTINRIRALNYPIYTPSGIVPPQVYIKVGESIKLKGIVTNTSITWRCSPMRHNKFMIADISFSLSEVLNISWSATEVEKGMERYVKWHDTGLA